MKQSIVSTLVFCFTLSTLSFAQESEKPKKERNWTVGVGGFINYNPFFPSSVTWFQERGGYRFNINASVGYKRWVLNSYVYRNNHRAESSPSTANLFFTLGYQWVLGEDTNAKYKPVLGVELGPGMSGVNIGVRLFNRHQVLLTNTLATFRGYEFVLPFVTDYDLDGSVVLKYQFLF
tara:strand:+ start:12392 stop:12922 length:531 start_codon:yes stop_codon:yes gene_type:complete